MSATKRISRDLMLIQQNPVQHVNIIPSESDMMLCSGTLVGPTGTPFEGGKFKIQVQFPTDYPFKPPQIKFLTKIYHPNIDESGTICLGLLKSENWKPSTQLPQLLQALVQLLVEPNPADPLEARIADMYQNDRPVFETTVKDWIKKYC